MTNYSESKQVYIIFWPHLINLEDLNLLASMSAHFKKYVALIGSDQNLHMKIAKNHDLIMKNEQKLHPTTLWVAFALIDLKFGILNIYLYSALISNWYEVVY